MNDVRRRFQPGVLLLLTFALSGCHGSTQTTPSPTIVISGPDTIAPGETGQFTATGVGFSGHSGDLTSEVIWVALSPAGPGKLATSTVLKFSASGEARGVAPGEATVRATLSELTSQSRTVFVLDPGTYRLTGAVSDLDGRIAGATIRVLSGVGAGLASTSAADGTFALYGVGGSVVLSVAAPGHETQTRAMDVVAHRTEYFDLPLTDPPADLSGSWNLSITVPAACRAILDPALQTRTQTAVITERGTSLDVITPLTAAFHAPVAHGHIIGHNFSLDLSYDDDIEHNLWEEHIGAATLTLYGGLAGTWDGVAVRGMFDGSVYYQATSVAPFIPTCSGSDGPFVMTRR